MNKPANFSQPQPGQASRVADAPVIDPNLSAGLQDDHDAVQEDLRQAKELAASLEGQLAGKSKELLHLKFLLEQSKTHLAHMQDGISAMRKERHKLANAVLRSPVMDALLSRVTKERDALRAELNRVLQSNAAEKAGKAPNTLHFDERDRQIADLTVELVSLRQEMAKSRCANPSPSPRAPESPQRPYSTKPPGDHSAPVEPDIEILPSEPALPSD